MLYYRLAKTETCCTKLDDTTGSYVIVPVSFSSLGLFAGASGGHQLQCTVHSTEPVLIEEVRIPPQLVGHAVIQQVMAKSKPPRIPIAVSLLVWDWRGYSYSVLLLCVPAFWRACNYSVHLRARRFSLIFAFAEWDLRRAVSVWGFFVVFELVFFKQNVFLVFTLY